MGSSGGFRSGGGSSYRGGGGFGGGSAYRGPSRGYSGSGYRGGHYGSGYRGGYYSSGFRYSYPRYSFGFGYYPGFYSGFYGGLGYGYGYGYGYDPYYYDGYYGGGYGGYVSTPAYYEQAPQAPPVVINEYYRPPTAQPRVRDYSSGGYGVDPRPSSNAPAANGPAKKPDYWLIAFPNGSIVLAVTYWTDGEFLHYVTRNKEPKQVPLTAIDRDLTVQLNGERGLDFRITR
jgi:hypothetical protein